MLGISLLPVFITRMVNMSCTSQQRVKAASSAEHMKVLAVESSSAESLFLQLDKLRMVYEEYVKIGKETIPLAEKNLNELTEELDQKSQALDDVIITSGTFCFRKSWFLPFIAVDSRPFILKLLVSFLFTIFIFS